MADYPAPRPSPLEWDPKTATTTVAEVLAGALDTEDPDYSGDIGEYVDDSSS